MRQCQPPFPMMTLLPCYGSCPSPLSLHGLALSCPIQRALLQAFDWPASSILSMLPSYLSPSLPPSPPAHYSPQGGKQASTPTRDDARPGLPPQAKSSGSAHPRLQTSLVAVGALCLQQPYLYRYVRGDIAAHKLRGIGKREGLVLGLRAFLPGLINCACL